MRRPLHLLIALTGLSLLGAGTPPAPTPKVTRVHVDKSARTMKLLDGDTVVATFAVAVGRGGAGPKKREGDSVTPIGRYRVVKHLPSHLRIFLQLDYPNA
ncbi:MAG TPA: L,D-transpeptidase family protein, partial [Labilithrix sp.]|nr:L,D-transpeptidase family protein [Labilithrix sp.]